MHVNLELQEDAFKYKKGKIIPALKDHIGYILFEEDHTRIYIENDNEYVKEVDYIKIMRTKHGKEIFCIVNVFENMAFGYYEVLETKRATSMNLINLEAIPNRNYPEEIYNIRMRLGSFMASSNVPKEKTVEFLLGISHDFNSIAAEMMLQNEEEK